MNLQTLLTFNFQLAIGIIVFSSAIIGICLERARVEKNRIINEIVDYNRRHLQ